MSNLGLRLVWVVFVWHSFSIFERSEYDLTEHFYVWLMVKLVLELVRRTQWALLRVENEAINNFEQYRTIYTIPPVADDTQLGDLVRLKRILA